MKYEEYEAGCSQAQIALLGPGRAGKTTLAYSVTHLGKTLGIESEEGVHAARDYICSENLEIELISKRVKDPKTGRMVPSLPEDEMPIGERLKELIEIAFSSPWDFVVVDSLTDIAGRFEDQYARKTGSTNQQDWYKIISGMKDFVRTLKRGNFHLVATCIAAPPRDGSMIEISPALPGQLRETLLPMFQSICLVGYNKKTKQRRLVVNDPARGLCDRFHSYGDAQEVDITDVPKDGIEGLILGATARAKEIEETGTKEEVPESIPVEDHHGKPVPIPETHDENGDPKPKAKKKVRRAHRVVT
tara:strand:+ start:39 stop:947 length:909 start_codon:yes stop_codon:yes gene_type:complete